MSRYQKGKTNLDFTEARDTEWQWHQLGHTVRKSAPRSRQKTTPAPHPLSFLQAECPSCRPTNSVKAKYKIKALFKDFQGPKLHFSSTKIIDNKTYPRCGHSKFRLQCDTEVYCMGAYCTHQYRNDKSK